MSEPVFRFSGPLDTSYRQFYVAVPDHLDMMGGDEREGQANGLCGGAIAGGVKLIVGMHTGESQFTVEVHRMAPPLDLSWDEIVEASCVFNGGPVALTGCITDTYLKLPAVGEGVYRARYCIRAFGATDEGGDRELTGEEYALLLWPEPWRQDQIIKQTSSSAQYWHRSRESANAPSPTPALKQVLNQYAGKTAEVYTPEPQQERASIPDQDTPVFWDPVFESWGMPHYFSARNPGPNQDAGPVTIGRVHGVENITLDQALFRIAATDIHARLPVPSLPLAAAAGYALRSQDAYDAAPANVIQLQPFGVLDPPVKSHFVAPFSILPAGTDSVLGPRSPHYKGTRLNDKNAKRIIAPVPAGIGVIGIGSDLESGAPLLREGRRVAPGDIAVLAMAGITQIDVFARPRVAVCVINKYYQGPGVADGNTIPDAVSPMVLALLARWGVKVDTVRHLDFGGRPVNEVAGQEINAIAAEHDLTIVLGFLGNDRELMVMRGLNGENMIQEEPIAPAQPGLDGKEYRQFGLYRPIDVVRLASGTNSPTTDDAKRCKLVIALRGLPLPVFTAMYTMVKPALDGLGGVGAYPVQHPFPYNFFSPRLRSEFGHDNRAKLFSRSEDGTSLRHGVRWLTGVLATPGPRDPQRHWLQLAWLTPGSDGCMHVHVLPSEEYQVRGLIGAEAMVAIEKGQGMMHSGAVVKYFMLD